MPSTSSLSRPEVLDVVLVELAHREADEAGLDRRPVEQGGVGQQHPARMDGDVARQPVEPLDEVEHQVEPLVVEPGGPQLGQVAHGHPGVAGPDVGERLGDRVGLAGRHAERAADVTDRVAHAVGVHHRDAHAALAAVAVEDRAVDLLAPGGLDVDVDVGQRGPQRREEALHQQAVADRVDPGDAEEVVDQAARARPAPGAAHPELADQVGDVADGQEVGRVAPAADHLQLVVEPLPDALARSAAVAAADTGLAARTEQVVGRRAGGRGGPQAGASSLVEPVETEVELREVDLAQAEVGARVEGAPVAHRPGVGQQPPGLAVGVAEPGQPGDLLGHLVHLLAGLEEALRVAPVDVPPVEGHQTAGGVEDVDDRGVAAVGVAHGVGEDRAQPDGAGEAGHPCGVRGGAGAPDRAGARQPVGDQLDQEVGPRDDLEPRLQRGPGEVVAAPRQGGPDLGGRTEQDGDVTALEPGGDQRQVDHRLAALTGQLGGRDQSADRRPARPTSCGAGVGQEGHPGQRPVVAEGTAPHRGARPLGHRLRRLPGQRGHRQVDAQHRPEPGRPAGPGVPDRAVGAVTVGQGEGVHLLLGGPLHEDVRVGRAVLQGVARRHVEVDEGVHPVSRPGQREGGRQG